MKTLLKGLGISVIVVLVLSAIAAVALAQGPGGQTGEGVCEVDGQPVGEGQMRGSMEWNRTGEQQGLGANENAPCDDFVDADGDGVCDLHDGEPNAPQMRGSRAASPGAGRMRQ